MKLGKFINKIPKGINHLKFTNYEVYPDKSFSKNCFHELHFFKTQPYYSYNFNSYANGKSMAKVIPYMQSNGSHEFKMLYPGKLKTLNIDTNKAVILHFDSCNFDIWWNKFKNLGKFSDKYKSKYGSWKNPFNFYKKSRDLISNCNESECKNKALQYYEKEKILKKENVHDLLKQRKIEMINPNFSKVLLSYLSYLLPDK